ncbi:MAG TPA: plastocyanin/azurin family copper-binding protein [Vicinamibacterales bacterium]
MFRSTQLKIAAIGLVVLSAACNSSSPSTTATPASTPAAAATSSEVTGIAPKNAIVTLIPAAGEPAMPAEPAVMDQVSKQFLPHTLMARVGQPVEFRNSEDMPHNVTVLRRESGSEVFNVSTDRGQKYVHTFDRVGQFDVKCDIHEGMEATVIVTRGPLTVIAGDDGRFSIPNVAFGSYKASVTFSGQTVEQPIEVSAARTELKLTR